MERPELATLIGVIAGEWGAIDAILAQMFNFVSYSEVKGGSHRLDTLATALFASLVATTAKTDLITTAIKLRLPSLLAEFTKLSKDNRTASKMRSDVVHASWNISDEYPNDLVRYDLDGNPIRYTKKCLEEILRLSTLARNKMMDFSIKAANTSRADPLYPSPKPTP